MPINLNKVIKQGTWRYIGQHTRGTAFSKIPIAGFSIGALIAQVGGIRHRIGRIEPRNAFVLVSGVWQLLYVRPQYRSYRKAANQVFRPCPWPIDYDHLLGRAIASQLGFSYVLLARVVPSANRSHGRYEIPLTKSIICLDKVAYADERIFDKWSGNKPKGAPQPYQPSNASNQGATLKAAGMLGYALGVEDCNWISQKLTPF